MTREKAQAAVDQGIGDFIADLAKMMASNEITETGEQAVSQFERGLTKARDAAERATVIVSKVFPL